MTSRLERVIDSRTVVERYCRALPGEFEVLSTLQHPEFVQEFPQSGEIIRGSENLRAIHERYPGGTPQDEMERITGSEDRWAVSPAFTLVRITGAGDTFTSESKAIYPDGSRYRVVTVMELKDGKVFRARTYFAPEFPPPAWRSRWASSVESI